jgi:hypothetical protein
MFVAGILLGGSCVVLGTVLGAGVAVKALADGADYNLLFCENCATGRHASKARHPSNGPKRG